MDVSTSDLDGINTAFPSVRTLRSEIDVVGVARNELNITTVIPVAVPIAAARAI